MAIKNSVQKWEAGQIVKVGFMTLTVVSLEPTPGDYRPDIYHLISAKGAKYTFTPHFGLERA
jgi:hypothetical protein